MKRRKSSGKKRICVFLIAVVIGCTGIYLYYSMRRVNIRSVQEISIEYLDGHYVRSIVMEKKDAEKLAGIISGKRVCIDTGFVFASGGYRIKIITEGKTIYLYPYCGDTSYMRVGHKGYRNITFGDKDAERIEKMIRQYIDTDRYGGDWDWENR